jgi:hypothetical protein
MWLEDKLLRMFEHDGELTTFLNIANDIQVERKPRQIGSDKDEND